MGLKDAEMDLNYILERFRNEKIKENERKSEIYWHKIRDSYLRARKVLGAKEICTSSYTLGDLGDMSGSKLKHATAEDYKEWLAGYLRRRERPTHFHDFPMERELYKFYKALANFEMEPFCEDSSINVIVPSGIIFLGGELGYANLYLMDGFIALGQEIPVYKDTKF